MEEDVSEEEIGDGGDDDDDDDGSCIRTRQKRHVPLRVGRLPPTPPPHSAGFPSPMRRSHMQAGTERASASCSSCWKEKSRRKKRNPISNRRCAQKCERDAERLDTGATLCVSEHGAFVCLLAKSITKKRWRCELEPCGVL